MYIEKHWNAKTDDDEGGSAEVGSVMVDRES